MHTTSDPPVRELLTVSTPQPGVVVACGELDVSTTRLLRQALLESTRPAATLTLDLSGVTFMDAAGLSTLIGARQRLTAAGGSLQLRSPHPRVRFLLRLTGLEEAFTILT